MHRLSDTLGPSKSTIHCHLTALGKIYKSCRFVPHELTAEQTQRRVEFCRKLLHLPKDHNFDEGQLPVQVTKREHFEKKGRPLRLVELRMSYLL
jgi:hypothetical protein